MAFLSGSTSFTRYRVIDELPRELLAQAPERLKRNAFKDIDNSADEMSWGWVCFENMLDLEWSEAPPEKGAYLAFSLRLDTRRVAPAVFKKYYRLALEQEERRIREQGRKYVAKERKKELREQVRLQLLSRTLPVPAVFDVAWNIDRGMVYFDSTRSKVCEMFMEHFTLTFDLHLEPLTPFFLALHLLGPNAQSRLESAEGTRFIA